MINAKQTDNELSPGARDPFRHLMAAILAHAAQDARAGDLGAALWILSNDCRDYAEALGISWLAMTGKARIWAAKPRGRLVVRVYEEGACLL